MFLINQTCTSISTFSTIEDTISVVDEITWIERVNLLKSDFLIFDWTHEVDHDIIFSIRKIPFRWTVDLLFWHDNTWHWATEFSKSNKTERYVEQLNIRVKVMGNIMWVPERIVTYGTRIYHNRETDFDPIINKESIRI